MAQRYSATALPSTLGADMSNSDAACVITVSTGWPTSTFAATIERGTPKEELILIGARAGGNCTTITRGLGGTAAVAHSLGAPIEHTADAPSMQRWEDHLFVPTAGHTAAAITNVPAGNIAAVNVQAALNELDTEKQPAGDYIVRTEYDANTVLAATADNAPLPLAVAASTILGRKATGPIAAMTPAEAKAVLAILSTDISDFVNAVRAAVPAGVMWDFAGAVPPTGWILCDGTVYARTLYPNLFTAIGTAWNTGGEAGTDFRVPDLRGRASIGVGTGSGLTARVLGNLVGKEAHALAIGEMPVHSHIQDPHGHTTPNHSHGITDVPHNHGIAGNSGPEGVFGGFYGGSGLGSLSGSSNTGITGTQPANSGVNNNTATNQNTGGGGTHPTMSPSAVVTKIIKT